MSDEKITQVAKIVEEAMESRSKAKKAVTKQIARLVQDLPVGAVLRDAPGDAGVVLRVVAVDRDYSQNGESGSGWTVYTQEQIEIHAGGGGYVHGFHADFFDGHNVQRLITDDIAYASAADVLDIAKRLPVALAAYLERCAATTASLGAAAESLATL